MKKWYKDRDFPEIKNSNSDIIAVITDPKQLERVIQEQNELVDRITFLESELLNANSCIEALNYGENL
jgi:hypothetical protein